jgi:hypothetical protein
LGSLTKESSVGGEGDLTGGIGNKELSVGHAKYMLLGYLSGVISEE